MEGDEDEICHMCETTEKENGEPLKWVEWMRACVCRECVDFFDQGKVKADAV